MPPACAYPDVDYYNTLLIKTIGPLVVLALLWVWPLVKFVRGTPYVYAVQRAAKLSLFWFQLIYISVSTTIMQCFKCEQIGGELLLRAQLTLACDGTGRRQAHVAIAAIMVLLYPIGVPALFFTLMYPNRHTIKTVMEAAKELDKEQSHVESLKRLSRRNSVGSMVSQLTWLKKQFKNYQPTCWCALVWSYFVILSLESDLDLSALAGMGIVVLLTRLCQTSLMVLCTSQVVQAGFASVVTLAVIIVQRETKPYRHSLE